MLARNPGRIDNNLLRDYPSFAAFVGRDQPPELTPGHASPAADAEATPEEQIEAAHVALHAALRDELLEHILQNSSAFFERLIVDLLVAMGYGGTHTAAAKQLGRSGDGGVDGVIDEDRLGLDRVYVQAKRCAATSSIGRPDVQGFVGSLVGLGAGKGVFVTTSSFSRQAVEFVERLPQRVVLIDGHRLANLMIEYKSVSAQDV